MLKSGVKMLNKKNLFVFILLNLLFLVSACKKKAADNIVFDNSYPLALAPDVEWAVVIEPYAVFRNKNDWGSDTEGHCRKGEILQVKGMSVDEAKTNWYYFEGGWLPQNCVSIFSNRYKAEAVSKNLLSSE